MINSIFVHWTKKLTLVVHQYKFQISFVQILLKLQLLICRRSFVQKYTCGQVTVSETPQKNDSERCMFLICTANFIASWLKWLQTSFYACNKSTEFIQSHLESWGDKSDKPKGADTTVTISSKEMGWEAHNAQCHMTLLNCIRFLYVCKYDLKTSPRLWRHPFPVAA